MKDREEKREQGELSRTIYSHRPGQLLSLIIPNE